MSHALAEAGKSTKSAAEGNPSAQMELVLLY